MALFSVIVYKQLERSPDELFAALTAVAHLRPRSAVETTVRSGHRNIYVHALRTPTGFYSEEEQTHATPHCAVLLNGYVYSYDKDVPVLLNASALARDFSISRFDDLAGEYAITHVGADGRITALADPDGLQNLFYLDTEEVFAVSTRPSLLASVTGHRTLDLHPLAWISAIGYRVGTRTGYADVRAIPQGTALVWDGRTTFVERRNALNRDHVGGLDAHSQWFEDQLERGVAAASRAVQLACIGKDRVDLPITGGKDSRMVLALCLAAGLRERLTLYTDGPPDHPDVVVGRMIADTVRLPHRLSRPVPVSSRFQKAPEFMHRIAAFAYQADGLTGAWDDFLTPHIAQRIQMSGHMGEVLKAYARRPFDPAKRIEPIELVKLQAPFDPMEVLQPWVREALADDLASRLRRLLERGFTHADLPDVYYYMNRVPNWLGGWRQVRSFHQEAVMPIGVPPLMRMAYVATAHERKIERIHYEIIRRLSRELVDLPFATQKWHPDLGAADIPWIDVPHGSSTPRHGSWQYSLNHRRAIRKAIARLIDDTAASPFWTILDADKLRARIRKRTMNMMDLISLLGILPSLMFATGRFTPMKVDASGSPLPLTPYAWPESRAVAR